MSNQTILLVDDEPDLLDLLREVLEMSGNTVLSAASGMEALQVWEKNSAQITLLVADLTLPSGTTGVELAKKLQALKPELKVIYTSGHDRATVTEKYSLPPEAMFLKKPFNPDTLTRAVECV
jgi:two-component system, cell cycle sensor histidine kinase and response regulator CckA